MGRKRIIIFYNAIYIYIKKFNRAKVSLNSSKSYTHTAGERLFINGTYLSLTDIREKEEKKTFFSDIKTRQRGIFKRILFTRSSLSDTRTHNNSLNNDDDRVSQWQ
jgi:hypothetical protein